MIAVITTPHWGDLILLAVLVTLTTVLIYLGCRLVDLAINAMQRPARQDFARHADDARRLADAGRDIAPEDEPSWPGKVDLLLPISTQPDDPARVDLTSVLGTSGILAETDSETSGRHAFIPPDDDTPTGLMAPVDVPAVVDGDAAMDAVAAVPGQDGAP